jgi:2-polyprenyl-3-methyl-5-hydroxy-6-metoxy-1,4-benzoquinol methylase
MRNWYKFKISDKIITDINERLIFTNYQLIQKNKNFKDILNFENFKKNQIFFKQYNFLKNNLDPDKETLFIGSSWGETEFFLKDKFKVLASDIEDQYIKFHKNNTDLNFIKLNILDIENQNLEYEQIVVNNVEYLFDNQEMKTCIENISKISKPGAKIFVIFRSRDGFLLKFIDQILTFAETYLVYLIKRINKKVYFDKNHHGFRRSLKEFKEIWIENRFEFKSIYEDLFEVDYDRLRIIQKLKISKFLSKIFLKSNPYLNILVFKKIK